MSRYNDAIGYLIDLRNEVAQPWFTKICDLAIDQDSSDLGIEELTKVASIFWEKKDYSSVFTTNYISGRDSSEEAIDEYSSVFLEELCDFENYKGIDEALKVEFNKRITVVFGTNGSGKSSICEAIKFLGSPNVPDYPIYNLKRQSDLSTEFSYKFINSSANRWSENTGYGIHSDKIRFFDSKISISLIDNPVDLEQSIVITPFRLHVFEFARNYLKQFQQKIDEMLSSQKSHLGHQMSLVVPNISTLEIDDGKAFTDLIRSGNVEDVRREISELEKIDLEELISAKEKELIKLNVLQSSDGKKALEKEIKEITKWKQNHERLVKRLAKVELNEVKVLVTKRIQLGEKLKELLNDIVGEIDDFDQFKVFLNASKEVLNYEDLPNNCPLCKQELDTNAKQLLLKYKEFLYGKTETDLNLVNRDLTQRLQSLSELKRADLSYLREKIESLAERIQFENHSLIKECLDLIPSEELDYLAVHKDNFRVEVASLNKYLDLIEVDLIERLSLLDLAENDSSQIQQKIINSETQLSALKQQLYIKKNRVPIREITEDFQTSILQEKRFLEISFQGLYQRITRTAKTTYEELLVAGFQQSLEEEYQKLTEMSLENLGISLSKKGREGNVFIKPTVGEKPIKVVLSEGELKVHALALFFCELKSSNENIIVIDDPVNSLDYNYVSNFVDRLRDFLIDNPNKQLVLFTHNWGFFEQFRDEINKTSLNHQFEVKIIEGCSVLRHFKENIDELKQEIDTFLNKNQLTNSEKREVSLFMRVLIETIVNEHVFNKQRYKYKKAKVQISNFKNYEKLIPLKPDESQKLRDLYKKLSPFEHDDERVWFTNTEVIQLQSRYQEIIVIETELLRRRT